MGGESLPSIFGRLEMALQLYGIFDEEHGVVLEVEDENGNRSRVEIPWQQLKYMKCELKRIRKRRVVNKVMDEAEKKYAKTQ